MYVLILLQKGIEQYQISHIHDRNERQEIRPSNPARQFLTRPHITKLRVKQNALSFSHGA